MTASVRQEPISLVLERLADGGLAPAKRGTGWESRCPAHEDTSPSLSVGVAEDGRVLVRCHAGCEFRTIVKSLGLQPRDLFRSNDDVPRRETSFERRYGREIAAYDYADEHGSLLYQVVRFERDDRGVRKKTFLQRRPDPGKRGGWNYRVTGVRHVLYRLTTVVSAVAEGRPVYVVEGEKCVERLVLLTA